MSRRRIDRREHFPREAGLPWRRDRGAAALNPSMALEARWRWCSTASTASKRALAAPSRSGPAARMTRQRDAGRAQDACAAPGPSTSTGTPSSPPRRPLGQRSRGNTLRQHQPRRPVAQGSDSPTPSDSMRCAAPSINAHVLGAVQLTGVDVDTLQRPAQRVHRRLELIESLDGLGTLRRLDSSRLALRRRTLSARKSPQASPSRSIAA